MIKPNNFNNVAAGGFVPVQLGGHYATIKKVGERKSRTGKDMIAVFFDFASNDKQANYFSSQFASDVRPDKKWPFTGSKYIMVNDYKGNDCSKDFKAFCSCIEESNGLTISWGEDGDWGAQFQGKKIGVVFGNVAYVNNKGEEKNRPEPRWFCRVDKVAGAAIPADKPLKDGAPSSSSAPAPSSASIADAAIPADKPLKDGAPSSSSAPAPSSASIADAPF